MELYFTKKAACFLLSVLLTASLAVSFFGVTAVCYARSDSALYDSISAYSDELKADLDEAVKSAMPNSELPAKAYADAIDGDAVDYIIRVSANNIAVQNINDFSLSSELYNTINSNLLSFAQDNGIKINSTEVSKLASLEVDVISGFMLQVNTKDVALYRICRNETAMVIIAVAVIAALMSYALIHIINDGRHRKNSYIGMAFVSTGYIQIVGTFAARAIDAGNKASGSGYEVFDRAIADVIGKIMSIQIPFGIILVVTGLAVLTANYVYFWKKNIKVNEQRRINSDMRDEYMRHYKRVHGEEREYVHGERETMDIDF